jgi:exodeoxyribonuclease VII large subunit
MLTQKALTVSELTNQIKQTLEEGFSQISVIGEISNFKSHVSGHWYFSLKDANATLSCTMWKGFNYYVFFTPRDGMKVILNGKLTVYSPKGNYQLDVRSMKPAGEGELQTAFDILKKKLAAEGLFEEQYKKPIPQFPTKIGIITAIDGAAFQDMISVAKRRFPLVELVISPARVQGSGAIDSIIESIRQLNRQPGIDVIILARGGGSIEDLWAFNEEIIVREIFKSKIPIITGIGHEIDFTISDFVADMRAPTPSVAMEMVTPDKNDFFAFVNKFVNNSTEYIMELCSSERRKIFEMLDSYGFRLPIDLVRRKSQQVDNLIYKVLQLFERKILVKANKLSLLKKSIEFHDVQKILKKGFVLVKQPAETGKFITRSVYFKSEIPAVLKFFDNEITVSKKD